MLLCYTDIPGMHIRHVYTPDQSLSVQLPYFTTGIQAGFPSPADDFIDTKLDLNEYLVKHPAATFFVRVSGDSMTGAGIYDNDILIVDRSLEARQGMIIIAALDGELTVKRLKKKGDTVILSPENDQYEPIVVSEEADFSVWGVVTAVIHKPC